MIHQYRVTHRFEAHEVVQLIVEYIRAGRSMVQVNRMESFTPSLNDFEDHLRNALKQYGRNYYTPLAEEELAKIEPQVDEAIALYKQWYGG
jgi:hypothetical protein